jgi:hypothetical protein
LDDAKSEPVEKDESEEEEPNTPILRRSMRERRKPKRYSPLEFCANLIYLLLMMIPKLLGK